LHYGRLNRNITDLITISKSVWYTNCDNIEKELNLAWKRINNIKWSNYTKDEFVELIAKHFSTLWQIHPFREGNTRTIVMLITFFVEHYGYYFDQDLIAQSAGYFRDGLVIASLDKFSEYEHLERILRDAICTEPIEESLLKSAEDSNKVKYEKYEYKDYKPVPHEYIEKIEN